MPRIRSLKPQFWSDSKTGTLSDVAKLTFQGIWNFSDDHGIIEWDPSCLKVLIWPYDQRGCHELVERPVIDELAPRGLVSIVEWSGGKQYLLTVNFRRHQKPKKPGDPCITGWDPKLCKVLQFPTSTPLVGNRFPTEKEKEKYEVEGAVEHLRPRRARMVKDLPATATPQSPRAATPVQKVVDAYKVSKNIDKTDADWDRANYGRYSKSASSLLKACAGEPKRAVAYLISQGMDWDEGSVSWTLETIARHAWDNQVKIRTAQEIGGIDVTGEHDGLKDGTMAHAQLPDGGAAENPAPQGALPGPTDQG